MAIAAGIVWEVRASATAANANGGGFKAGASGTDWSKQNGAQYNLTGATTAAANAIILHASAAADMVGNIAHVISGTNFTTGWYEIISVVAGVSITVDRNCTSAAGSVGVVNIGGAISMNSTTANQTDTSWAAAVAAGNTVYFRQDTGTITVAATCTFANGTVGAPVQFLGYTSTRGDNPTGTSRPTLNCQTFTVNTGSFGQFRHIILTGSGTNILTCAIGSLCLNCKCTNTSTTAARTAFNLGSNGCTLIDCEAISYRGSAINANNTSFVFGCYAHDSDKGVAMQADQCTVQNCIIESNVTAAISCTSGQTLVSIIDNTLYGGENKTGTGIILPASSTARIMNNIIYGFATGIADSGNANESYGNYNALNNNTANYSTFVDGPNSVTTAPGFVGVAQITGTNGTTSGSVLTSAGANFSTVTDNRDFLYIVSGTGITAGQYLITGHTTTTLTLDIAPGTNATADKVFKITTGRNFQIGANLKGLGFPATFQAGLTTSYSEIGGIQREGGTSVDPGVANVNHGTAYTIDDAALTGTAYIPTAANTRYGVNVGTTTGLLDLPAISDVASGVVFDNTTKTGTYLGGGSNIDPGIANVRHGTSYEIASVNLVGTAYIPAAADVRLSTNVDATTGTLDLPALNTVLSGITFDGASKTGTLAVPTVAQIVNGVLDEALSGHATAGTVGKKISDTFATASYTAPDNATITAIAGYVDTEVAAIKAKTDNLPTTPASQGDVTTVGTAVATLSTKIGTPAGASIAADIAEIEVESDDIAAIKAKTDNLPSDPADASDIATAFSTVASEISAIPGAASPSTIADAIWAHSFVAKLLTVGKFLGLK